MRTATIVLSLTFAFLGACKKDRQEPTPPPEPAETSQAAKEAEERPRLDPTLPSRKAPDEFRVRFETTKGTFVVEAHRSWSPRGVDRFYYLVKGGFYDDAAFFRVLPGFVVQFGLPSDPELSKAWRGAHLQDDPTQRSNERGTITFATSGPNTRTTQLFINYANNTRLDHMGFTPFGEVIEGMDVVDSINAEYGEQPSQGRIINEGNAYLKREFPNMDYILTAKVIHEVRR